MQSSELSGRESCSIIIEGEWIYNASLQVISNLQNESFSLRSKTAEVFNLLVQNHKNIVTSELFFQTVWSDKFVSENVLKQSISELRSYLGENSKSIIKTVPKQGYCLSANIDVLSIENNLSMLLTEGNKKPGKEACIIDTPEIQKPKPQQRIISDNRDKSAVTRRIAEYTKSVIKSIRDRGWSQYSIVFTVCVFCPLIMALTISQFQLRQYKQREQNQQVRYYSLVAGRDFFKEILSRYYSTPQAEKELFKSVLDKSGVQIERFTGSIESQLGKLVALFELYRIGGYYNEARLIISRIEENVEALYGKNSTEFVQVKFDTIEILINLRRRQEAYDVARYVLEITKQQHLENNQLLAKAFFLAGRAYLFCMEPFCERADSMKNGEQLTRTALELYQAELDEDAIEIADTYYLLNWFIRTGKEKIALVESAKDIYQRKLGDYHEKTAAALVELGRILTFYERRWEQGEAFLLKAFEIHKQLYPDNHPAMAVINGYLGEHYFMVSQYDKAIRYSLIASKITSASRGEGNDSHLEDLMLTARSMLYRGDPENAKKILNKAFDIIRRHKLTPAFLIFRALNSTLLRTQIMLKENIPDYPQLIEEINNSKETFKASGSVLVHEHQTQLLLYYPEHFSNKKYLDNLRILFNNLNPKSRYLYRSDLLFLQERASQLCSIISPSFCVEVTSSFSDIDFNNG